MVLVVASSPADPSAESSDWVVAVIVSAASFLRLHALLTSNKTKPGVHESVKTRYLDRTWRVEAVTIGLIVLCVLVMKLRMVRNYIDIDGFFLTQTTLQLSYSNKKSNVEHKSQFWQRKEAITKFSLNLDATLKMLHLHYIWSMIDQIK